MKRSGATAGAVALEQDGSMNSELLEEILACPRLPSLPTVALEVIELTSDPNVSMDALAKTIQLDQALTLKIVRTVNSSFYGLRRPCANVRKALVMLGLGPVKTLALGFSLVSGLEGLGGGEFDWVDYWRRALYSALGARSFAEAQGKASVADESFLAALMQDVGMVAMYEALGAEYVDVVQAAGGEHRKLAREELKAFDLTHADIGAMLAQRWRLPDQLVIPIKYHEKPTAAPGQASEVTRLVSLGTLVHDVLSEVDSVSALRRLYEKAKSWWGIDEIICDEVIRNVGAHAKEMSSLFNVDTGACRDADALLERAEQQLIELSKSGGGASAALLDGSGDQTFANLPRDPLTGAAGQEAFTLAVSKAFEVSSKEDRPATVVHVAVEGLDAVCKKYGPIARDEALLGLVTLLNREFESRGGLVCRVGQAVFAIVLADIGRREATKALEEFRSRVGPASAHWSPDTNGEVMPIAISAGVATIDAQSRWAFTDQKALVGASARATQAARASGGNCVRAFVPRKVA